MVLEVESEHRFVLFASETAFLVLLVGVGVGARVGVALALGVVQGRLVMGSDSIGDPVRCMRASQEVLLVSWVLLDSSKRAAACR